MCTVSLITCLLHSIDTCGQRERVTWNITRTSECTIPIHTVLSVYNINLLTYLNLFVLSYRYTLLTCSLTFCTVLLFVESVRELPRVLRVPLNLQHLLRMSYRNTTLDFSLTFTVSIGNCEQRERVTGNITFVRLNLRHLLRISYRCTLSEYSLTFTVSFGNYEQHERVTWNLTCIFKLTTPTQNVLSVRTIILLPHLLLCLPLMLVDSVRES